MTFNNSRYLANGIVGLVKPGNGNAKSSKDRLTVSICVDNGYFDKNANEYIQRDEWVDITFFGAVAQSAEKRLNPGDRIQIEARVRFVRKKSEEGTLYFTNFEGLNFTVVYSKPKG